VRRRNDPIPKSGGSSGITGGGGCLFTRKGCRRRSVLAAGAIAGLRDIARDSTSIAFGIQLETGIQAIRSLTARAAAPVSLGSAHSRVIKTNSCLVTEAWFPPGTVLDQHRHDGTVVAVMLEGSFTTVLGQRHIECTPSTAWTEPAEERHANVVGPRGARVVVAQLDHRCTELFKVFGGFVDAVTVLRDPVVTADAYRVSRELAIGDAMSEVAIEALILAMISTAARSAAAPQRAGATPEWLSRAREIIHAGFRHGLRLSEIAEGAGVHPSHLAHEFRRRFRCTVGEYARKLRLDWAAERLRTTDDTLTDVAFSAGYCDQAHLTRECTRALGVTPARLRARLRGGGQATSTSA